MIKDRSQKWRMPTGATAGIRKNQPSGKGVPTVNDTNFCTFRAAARTLEQLQMIGVTLRRAKGPISYSINQGRVWKEIGRVGVCKTDGRIALAPCEGLTDRDRSLLLGFAENAFRNQPSEATGWTHSVLCPDWWECTALITAHPDEAAAAITAEAERVLLSTPAADVDVDRPIDLWPADLIGDAL